VKLTKIRDNEVRLLANCNHNRFCAIIGLCSCYKPSGLTLAG
jgi:hypothetical protein